MENLMKVVSVSETKTASNGRSYKTVQFVSLPKMITVGGRTVEVKSNQKAATRNLWADFKDEVTNVVQKGDSLFNDIAVGDIVEGKIVTVSTTDYAIGERTVNSWTGVIFSNEDQTKYINSQLKANNASVVEAVSTAVPVNTSVRQLQEVF